MQKVVMGLFIPQTLQLNGHSTQSAVNVGAFLPTHNIPYPVPVITRVSSIARLSLKGFVTQWSLI